MKKDNYFFFWVMGGGYNEARSRAGSQLEEAIYSTWDHSLEARYFYAMSPSKVNLGETSRISSLRAYRENFS